MVARLHLGDRAADLLDHTRALVAQHRGGWVLDDPLDHAEVAVAEPGGADLDLDLGGPRRADLDVLADLDALAVVHDSLSRSSPER